MKVNDRKLFANRDARRRLSEMGGIVASYPELLGAAQKFQVGGEARFMNPNDRTNLLLNSPYVMDQAEILGMTPADFAGGLSPARTTGIIEDELTRMRAGAPVSAEPMPTPTATGRVPMLEEEDWQRSQRAIELFQNPPQMETEEEAAANAAALEEAQRALAARRAMQAAERAARNADAAEATGRDNAAELRAEADRLAAEAAALGATPAPARLETDTPEEVAPTQGPDDGSRAMPTVQEVEEAVTTSDDPSEAAASTVLSSLGDTGFDLGSVEGRISAYEELFTRMLGEDDEEKRREKYMNLAMIGFAIAAGEDPSALKNIADGLLAGTAQMQESAAARRERENRIQELAIQAGIGDQQLADRLAAASAEDVTSWIETPQGEATVDLYKDLTTTGNMSHEDAIARLDQLTPGLGSTLQRAMSTGVTPPTVADPTALLNQAREAIDAGRDRGTVEQMLRDMGVDPSLLNE